MVAHGGARASPRELGRLVGPQAALGNLRPGLAIFFLEKGIPLLSMGEFYYSSFYEEFYNVHLIGQKNI